MDFKDIQDTEVEALRAIFMDDFNEVESHTVWKSVNAVHEFALKIYPAEEDLKTAVNLVLHVKLPKTYPKLAPQIELERVVGISPAQRDALQDLLKSTSKSLLGNEMIYELATAASNFIADHNTVVRFGKVTSLIEDRAKRAEEEEIIASNEAAIHEQQQAKLRLEEARLMQAEMEANEYKRSRLREQRMQADREATQGTLLDDPGYASIEKFEKPLRLPGNLLADVLVRGSVICHTAIGTYYHAQAVASSRHGVTLPCALLVIDLNSPYFSTAPGIRKLETVEDSLTRMSQLKSTHLLEIYGYKRVVVKDNTSSSWQLLIVMEPLPRSTLYDLLEDVGELRLRKALPYWKALLSALVYLHGQGIAHRAISPKHVHIGRTESGEVLVKVSCSSWYQLLLDINRSNKFLEVDPPTMPDEWLPPQLQVNPLAIDKSFDIWDSGVLLAQTLYGLEATSIYPTPAHLMAEIIDSPIGALLATIFDAKPPSASRLLERLETLSISQSTEPASLKSPVKSPGFSTEPMPSFAFSQAFSPPNQSFLKEQAGLFFQPRAAAVSSRYRSEFEEVEKLGQGGFGQVVKARNKLDNNFYAIKKVKLPSDTSLESKILREVTIWGRLSHPGIVRYHTSWVESETTSTDAKHALGMLTSGSASGTGSKNDTTDSTTDSDSEDSYGDDDDSDVVTISHGDEDFDLGIEDLDFISSGHQNRSLSMPTIHFGDEDDPSTEASRAVTRNATPELQRSLDALPPSPPRQTRTLLIQMEFVSGQTLREQIDEGITEEEMWRILRQILNAMRYFTSFNIIHRDMKPSNILLDAAGSVRIADFGLAVEQSAPDQLANMSASALQADSDLTSGVGTSMYLAPETIDRRKNADKSGRYTDKIDMYSLGIIIFEMCWPIETRMERIDILKALRRPEISFPPGWDETDPRRVRQGKIIRWCLSHDPVKRAGPLDLLRSELLPAAVQDDYISDTLALLAQPNSPHIQTILTTLFQAHSEDRRAQELAFDVEVGDSELNNPYDKIVKHKLEHIFQLRGAVDFSPPLLMPLTDLYDEKARRPVRMLNRHGTPVQLPYDLVLPLARFVARDDTITRLKRFNISPVYREDRMGGQPKAFLAASYDVISRHHTLAAEAECIQAIDEVLSETAGNEDIAHVIGHFDFVAAILESLPKARRMAARRTLERYELLTAPWTQVIGEMAKLGLSRKRLDDLAALDICDTVQSVERRISSLSLDGSIAPMIKSALKDVKKVAELCSGLGVSRRILLSPLLCFKPELNVGGICFQSRLQKTRKRDIYAEGGRYDQLLQDLSLHGARQIERSHVGASLAVSKLSQAMASRYSGAADKSKADAEKVPRRCEIYVVSYASGLIDARLVISRELWKNGLSADLMYDDDLIKLGPDRIASTARKEGIRYLVIVKATTTARDAILKVKDLASNAEREVYRQDLASHLADRLGDVAVSTTADAVASSSGKALPGIDSLDAHLSMPTEVLKKMKHKQKQIVLEKAVDSVTDALTATTNIPLFAVDAEGESFRLMAESCAWITHDPAGQGIRRILEAAPAARKSYILQLRDELQTYYEKNRCRWMWLYSLKDTKVNLLSFV